MTTRAQIVLLSFLGLLIAVVSVVTITRNAATGAGSDAAVEVTVQGQGWNGWEEDQPPPDSPVTKTMKAGDELSTGPSSLDVTITVHSISESQVVLTTDTPMAQRSKSGTGWNYNDLHSTFTIAYGEQLHITQPSYDAGLHFTITIEKHD